MPVTIVMYASNQSKTNLTEPSYRTLLITLLLHSFTGFAYRFEIPKCKPIYYDNNITRQSLEICLVRSTVWICACYHQLTPVRAFQINHEGVYRLLHTYNTTLLFVWSLTCGRLPGLNT